MRSKLPEVIPGRELEPLEIPVELGEPIVTDHEAADILSKLSLVEISEQKLSNLRRLGIHMHGAAMFQNQRGSVVVAQARLDEAARIILHQMQLLDNKGKNTKAKSRALKEMATTLGYITARMLDSQRMALQLEGGKSAIPASNNAEPTTRPFARGQIVTAAVSNEIHIHPPSEAAKPETQAEKKKAVLDAVFTPIP